MSYGGMTTMQDPTTGRSDEQMWLAFRDELTRYAAEPRTDRLDVFPRMAFNALVSNTIGANIA